MPVMPIHTGANVECPAGVLPHMHIKAIIERLASRQAAVFVYMCLFHTVHISYSNVETGAPM